MQHGGREEKDLLEDDRGWYVYMGNGFGGLEKVYLPNWMQPLAKK